MDSKYGGGFTMIKINNLPDKIFGIDTRIIILWLQPLVLVLVILFSVLLVIVPKINQTSEKMTEVKRVAQKLTEVNEKRTYLQTVNQEETRINAIKLAAGLLPEKNSYLLVRIIRDIAAGSNFNIDDFSVSLGDIKNDEAEKDNSDYDRIPVTVTLIGPADNYLSLVKGIERSLPIMSIEKFEMRSSSGVAIIKLNVLAYYLKDISNLKLENLTLGDLTPSQDEATLLSTIGEFQTMTVESNSDIEREFVNYGRQDPFSTL